jgi:hypothetical protein
MVLLVIDLLELNKGDEVIDFFLGMLFWGTIYFLTNLLDILYLFTWSSLIKLSIIYISAAWTVNFGYKSCALNKWNTKWIDLLKKKKVMSISSIFFLSSQTPCLPRLFFASFRPSSWLVYFHRWTEILFFFLHQQEEKNRRNRHHLFFLQQINPFCISFV